MIPIESELKCEHKTTETVGTTPQTNLLIEVCTWDCRLILVTDNRWRYSETRLANEQELKRCNNDPAKLARMAIPFEYKAEHEDIPF